MLSDAGAAVEIPDSEPFEAFRLNPYGFASQHMGHPSASQNTGPEGPVRKGHNPDFARRLPLGDDAKADSFRDAVRFWRGGMVLLQELEAGQRVAVLDLSVAEELNFELDEFSDARPRRR